MKPKRPAGPRLGVLLETRGRLQREVLIDALRHQRAQGGRIGTCLVELAKITEDDLLHVLSDQLKVPFTPPEDLRSLPEEVVKLIPEKVARQRFSIPLRSSSTHLTVAMRDPTDLLALDELAFVTGKRVRPQVASEIRILEALSKYYGVELAGRFVKLLERLNRERSFWSREVAAAAATPAAVDLPAIVLPPTAPDLRPVPGAAPAPPASSARASGAATLVAPSAAIAAPPPVAPPAPATTASPPEPAATAAPPPESQIAESGRLSIEAAEARLREPSGRDEVGRLLLEFARGRAASALLLMVRRDEAAGWLGFGPGLDDDSVESCKVDLLAPSFVRALRDGATVYRGPLAELSAHAEIRAMLGTNWATDLIALPLRVRGRLVSVLVATLEEGVFAPEQVEELNRLVAKASVALELLVLKQKLHG